jgi:hypothetical protein
VRSRKAGPDALAGIKPAVAGAEELARTVELGTQIGCRALLVHAENLDARAFYLRLVPEFEDSPTDALHLVLLMKDIRKSLG